MLGKVRLELPFPFIDLNLLRQRSELEDCGQFNSELTDSSCSALADGI
jgi:hypothetical protein